MDNTKKVFREIEADAMLTVSEDLRKYLTGFGSSFGYVYTDAQESIFFTDPRYIEGAKSALKGEFISVEVAQSEASVLEYIKSKKVKKLAVPVNRLTVPNAEILKKFRFKVVDSSPAFEKLMSVKNEEEMSLIRKACEIAEKAYSEFLGFLREGISETESAGYLEYLMRKYGAEDRSFQTIVAFGKNTSVPHHAPDETSLKKGMPVLLDFGCRYKGYCSDMTRTFLFGKGDNAEFCDIYEAVYGAHMRAFENIHSGMTGRAADALARDYLKTKGLDKFFTHSLGHGIGINIHEFPRLSVSSNDVLKDGYAFSVEPGVYFEGKFGIRIEDSVYLENGKVYSFMNADKKLMTL